MIVFPNCKINLGLNIIRKRDDNFHDLETVFFPLPFNDVLEVIRSESSQTEFINTGLAAGDTEDNLCLKTYHLIKKDIPQLPAVKMHLHKAIPLGAGLGGGSADAAFTLKLLNEKFKLDLSDEQLLSYALHLGSDCPFFLINKPCFASGRGEVLEHINVDLAGYKILLVNPGIHISTGLAFSKLKPKQPSGSIRQIITEPIDTWKEELVNDFEIPVFEEYPIIKKIKKDLYDKGGVYASMSGSGSTVFGIFKKTVPLLDFPGNYFTKLIDLE